jgi:maltose-binding protein MalE
VVTELTPEFGSKTVSAAYLGGAWQMVAKETRDVDAALDLVSYLTGYDMSLAVAQSQYTVPGRKSTEKEPYLDDPLLRPFYESLQYGWAVPQHPQYGKIRLKLVEVIRDAMQQKRSVKEALADAAAYSNALLAA